MPVTLRHRRSPRVTRRAIGLAAVAFAAAALLTWNPAQATGWDQGSAEATLWQLMNGARANNGLAPVQSHGTLVGLARWRSSDMIQRDYFSHTILGSGCEVYCYYDSNGLSYVWGGENIGWNSGRTDEESPIRVHEQFMGSAGHRANVLNSAWTHGGVGAYAADGVQFQGYVQNPRMFTQLFMQAASAPPPPPPAPAPAPAPPPPSGGGGSAPAPAPVAAPRPPASGGGGSVPAPNRSVAAPVAAAAPEPEPLEMAVAAPQRPSGGAEVDGVTTVLARPSFADSLAARLAADDALGVERHASPGKLLQVLVEAPGGEMRVETAQPAERGFFESVLGSLLALVFG
jgi:uncharacterized protein YkwD